MKVYISGPISGHDLMERREYFANATNAVRAELEPDLIINPMALEPNEDCGYMCDPGQLADQPPYIHTWTCWMRRDIKAMMDCDTIVMLPNWTESPGALFEYQIAERLGFKIVHMDHQGCTSEA